MSSKNDIADLIVVGGGVSGSAVALTCAAKGFRVLVLHREDDRQGMESLSPFVYKQLGPILNGFGTNFSHVIAWWGDEQQSRIETVGAHIICREQLGHQMRLNAKKHSTFVATTSMPAISRVGKKWVVSCNGLDGHTQSFEADFLCDATGRPSAIGRLLGAQRKNADNLCCALMAVEGTKEAGVWTESVANGWWNLCSNGAKGTLGFYSASNIIRIENRNLIACLNQTKQVRRFFSSQNMSPSRVHHCNSSLLVPCAGPGWVAVGDAAMAVQPLASAGVAKALRDADLACSAFGSDGQAYSLQRQVEFKEYLEQLSQQYRRESRWRASEFWGRYF
jgi:flavin-dependent dehydrogenase